MIYVFLALGAYALWAVSNLIDKHLVEKQIKNPFMLMVFSIILFCSITFLMLPFIEFSKFNSGLFFAAALSGALVLPGYVLFLKALQIEEASRVVPLWQFSPLFTFILAVIFLGEGEIFTTAKYVAFFLLITGGFLVSAKGLKQIFKPKTAFYLMIASSFLFALSNVLLKYSYSGQHFLEIIFFMQIGQLFVIALIFLMLGKKREEFIATCKKLTKKKIGLLLGTAAFAYSGRLLFNYAIMVGLVSIVTVLVGFQSFFTLVFASFLSVFFPGIIKEELERKALLTKLFAIALMTAGLYFLYL